MRICWLLFFWSFLAHAQWEVRHDGGADLYSIWGKDQLLLSIGAKGTLLRSIDRGNSWETQTLSTESLYAIWGSAERLYITGANGTFLSSSNQGETWATHNTKSKATLRGIWGDSQNRLFVVGDAGTILFSSDGGTQWQKVKSGTNVILHAIWGNEKNLLVVGEDGLILLSSDQGKTWQKKESNTQEILRNIRGNDTSIYISGYQGTLLSSETKGDSWTSLSSPTKEWLVGLWVGDNSAYVCGGNGVLLQIKPQAETLQSNTSRPLYSLWQLSENEVFAVGREGLILSKPRPPRLTITSPDDSLQGATLWIDTQKIDLSSWKDLPLSPGKHQISLTKEGFEGYSTELELFTGEAKELIISLRPIEPPASQPMILAPLVLPLYQQKIPPDVFWPKTLYRTAATTASVAIVLSALGIREALISETLTNTTDENRATNEALYQQHQTRMFWLGTSADILWTASVVMTGTALTPKLIEWKKTRKK